MLNVYSNGIHRPRLLLNSEGELLAPGVFESTRRLDVQDSGQRDRQNDQQNEAHKQPGPNCGGHEAHAINSGRKRLGPIEFGLDLEWEKEEETTESESVSSIVS